MLAPALTSSLADWLKPCHATSCSAVFPSCPFKQKENAVRIPCNDVVVFFFFKHQYKSMSPNLLIILRSLKKKSCCLLCSVHVCTRRRLWLWINAGTYLTAFLYDLFNSVFFPHQSAEHTQLECVCVCICVCFTLSCLSSAHPSWMSAVMTSLFPTTAALCNAVWSPWQQQVNVYINST